MKRTPQILHATNPAHRRPPVCNTGVHNTATRSPAARRDLWVLGPLATAVPVTPVLLLAGADWTAALWFAAVLWGIAASFVQSLWQGLRHGDFHASLRRCAPRFTSEPFSSMT